MTIPLLEIEREFALDRQAWAYSMARKAALLLLRDPACLEMAKFIATNFEEGSDAYKDMWHNNLANSLMPHVKGYTRWDYYVVSTEQLWAVYSAARRFVDYAAKHNGKLP